jgi:5-methylcytosine-specific restriction enzyme subunit McrC
VTGRVIHLREWQAVDPASEPALRGVSFEADERARMLARALSESNRLEITELRSGLRLESRAFVGTVRVGPVTVVIQPKIDDSHLTTLLRYAYGLGDLALFSPVAVATRPMGFQDLFVHQLHREVARLAARGLHRDYEAVHGDLTSPRGRIVFGAYPRNAASAAATLPVVHHPRLADSDLNRVILAGLHAAARVAVDIELRTKVRRLAALIAADVGSTVLSRDALRQARRKMDRRHINYEPSLTIIELLLDAAGIDLEGNAAQIPLDGFLFDMNRFFQALLSRFLRENLSHLLTVRDESTLKGLFAYDSAHNPRGRRAPSPRPDLVIMEGNKSVAVLDAKYRDLWERPLPRDMLYQLSLYALAQTNRTATILYPTLSPAAEQRILFNEPVHGLPSANIVLRPVNLLELASVVSRLPGGSAATARRHLASRMAFGLR